MAKALLPRSSIPLTSTSAAPNAPLKVGTIASTLPTTSPSEVSAVSKALSGERVSRRSLSKSNLASSGYSPCSSPRASPDLVHCPPRECRSWPGSRSSSVSSNHRPLTSARSMGSLKGKTTPVKKEGAHSSRNTSYHNHRHSPYPPGATKRSHGPGGSGRTTSAASPSVQKALSPGQPFPREDFRAEASVPIPLGTSTEQEQDEGESVRYPFEYSSFLDLPPSTFGEWLHD